MSPLTTDRRRLLLATAAALGGCAQTADRAAHSDTTAVEVIRSGTGRPPIVLEAGLGNGAGDWGGRPGQLLPQLAAVSEVFAYSRPGYGGSARTTTARDPSTIARELRALLTARNVPPPYVLVGHSLGGLYMEVFAAMYPAATSALILLDPTHARQWEGMTSRARRDAAVVTALSAAFNQTMKAEFEASKTPPPALSSPFEGPVHLLLATRPDQLASAAFIELRAELMRDLASSYRTRPEPIDAGHFIHRDKPGSVVAAVQRAVDAARTAPRR